MPRNQRPNLYHELQGQDYDQGRRDYDEDWDDDVYYAAASRPGESGEANGRGSQRRDGKRSKGSNEASTAGRRAIDRTPLKRHYMKVPNMRQPRAMRPTADGLGGARHHPQNTDTPSSPPSCPTSSGEADVLGDTNTSSSADTSSVPALGQLTPPSQPDEGFPVGSGGVSGGLTATAQTETPLSGVDLLPPAGKSSRTDRVDTAAVPWPGESSLVSRRSSPRSVKLSGQSRSAPFGGISGGDDASDSFTAVGGHLRRAMPAALVAEAGTSLGGGSVGSGKRRSRADLSQRFGSAVWPKLRGAESPAPRSSRKNTDGDMHGERHGPPAGGTGGTSGGLRGSPGSWAARASGSQSGQRRRATAQKQWKQQKHQPSQQGEQNREKGRRSSTGLSSVRSVTPRGGSSESDEARNSRSRGSPDESSPALRRGAKRARDTGRGPVLADRPARWAAKGAVSAASSPLRSDGNKSVAGSPRGVGNSSATARQSPSKTDPGIQMAGSRRDGGQTQASGPGNSQESTLELTSLFQAKANVLSNAQRAWGREHPSVGRREGSHFPPLRSTHSDDPTIPLASFDPTRMGAAAAGGAFKTEEVEEVASDESDGATNAGDLTDGPARRAQRSSAIVTAEAAGEYDELFLGEEQSSKLAENEQENLKTETFGGVDPASASAGATGAQSHKSRPAGDTSTRTARRPDLGKGDFVPSTSTTQTPQEKKSLRKINDVSESSPSSAVTEGPRPGVGSGAGSWGEATAKSEARRGHQQLQQPQDGAHNESNPLLRTPVRRRPSGRGPPSSASTADVPSSGDHGKWRPSFGSAGDRGAPWTGTGRSPGTMNAPWAAFSTPLKGVMPQSGSGVGSSVSTRRKRGGGAGNGPLGKLLQQVRARFDGDEARLLSGEFPFRPIPVTTTTAAPDGRPSGRGIGGGVYRKDHGDPRTRCGVALDVTIQPVDPRSRGTDRKAGVGSESDRDLQQGVGSGGLVRLSCFVHNVVNLVAGVADKGNGEIAFKRLRTLEGLRVDALFKHDTRRALDLCAGSQLRMYDPSCVWQHVEEEEDGVPGVAAALLMCTQLCEPYPACLTPLPSSA